MAVSFTRAEVVLPGEGLTSAKRNLLARAFNSRLRSGLGDGTWRIYFWFYSLFRSIRNPNFAGGGQFYPSAAEFFNAWQHVKPEDGTWPLPWQVPGGQEGINVANMMGAFVFGYRGFPEELVDEHGHVDPNYLPTSSGAEAEDARVNRVDPAPASLAGLPGQADEGVTRNNAAALWSYGKSQRGGWDPFTGLMGSPSFAAAREFYKVRTHPMSPHGNSYGGFMPQPDLVPGNEDCLNEALPTPNYQIKFTATKEGREAGYGDVVFNGSCPNVPGHVASVIETASFYYIYQYESPNPVVLPTFAYVEGPYTGVGILGKRPGGHVQRVMHWFVKEFRGSEAERAEVEAEGKEYHLQEAFDFDRFLKGQYHLAPNFGVTVEGAEGPEVEAVYPLFRFDWDASGAIKAGSRATHEQSGELSYEWHTGFVITGLFVDCGSVDGEVEIEMLMNGQVAAVFLVGGTAQGLAMFDEAVNPGRVEFRLRGPLSFTSDSGFVRFECTEMMNYKPQMADTYLMMRLAGNASGPLDNDGRKVQRVRELGEKYFQAGCLFGEALEENFESHINHNGMFEAARRMSQCVRQITRDMLVAYELTGGRSVLYFNRRASVMGGLLDAWEGIAPSLSAIESGQLQSGRRYVVKGTSGEITYGESAHGVGSIFTSVFGVKEFTASGDAQVFEYEGIIAAFGDRKPPENGESNEWLMRMETQVYGHATDSIFKPDSFADYFGLSNRCHLFSADIEPGVTNAPLDLWRHFGYSQGMAAPEAPSGYNYMHGVNHRADTNFYKSCRLYQPDAEVRSVRMAELPGWGEVVRVEFHGRLHHCEGEAPNEISWDVNTWNAQDVRNEPYRSWENAIREHLIYLPGGVHQDVSDDFQQCSNKAGDIGAGSQFFQINSHAHGSCLPRFMFTKLVPEVHIDGDAAPGPNDTRVTMDAFAQMEVYLRAMCEGYVDGETSAQYGCETGIYSSFDYTFENLCLKAFDGRWLGTIWGQPEEGYGPLPNTEFMAGIFNRFALAINKLDHVRVTLPSKFEIRSLGGLKQNELRTDWPTDGGVEPLPKDCDQLPDNFLETIEPFLIGDNKVAEDPAGIVSEGVDPCGVAWRGYGWRESDAAQGVRRHFTEARCNDAENLYIVRACVGVDEFRFTLLDPEAIHAIPHEWRDMVGESGYHSFVGVKRKNNHWVTLKKLVSNEEEATDCVISADKKWWRAADEIGVELESHSESITTCEFFINGRVEADPPAPDAVVGWSSLAGAIDTGAGKSCSASVSNTTRIQPILNEAFLLRVPLVSAVYPV